jgi:predicted dehydrogenase
MAALEAGKHVLCEKPFTANADEARQVADVAAKHPDLVVMEAFHYRYHPLIPRLLQIIATELGDVQRIETRMCIPLPMRNDIRFQLDLAGGALMDTGCYAVHQMRTLAGAEPTVVSADVKTRGEQIDRWAKAELRFEDGRTGSAECALWSSRLLSIGAEVVGSRGTLRVFNMTGPQYYHRVTVKARDPRSGKVFKRREKVDGKATYWYQLQAFAKAARDGDRSAVLTPPADSIANMEVIDAIYRAAGLDLRQPTP